MSDTGTGPPDGSEGGFPEGPPSMEEIMAAIQPLVDFLYTRQVTMLVYGACLSYMVWDAIIVTDKEIKYVWRSKMSLMKSFWYINRYFAPVYLLYTGWILAPDLRPDLADKTCQSWISAGMIISTFTEGGMNWMFILRAKAVYPQRYVGWFLNFLFFGSYLAALVLTCLAIPSTKTAIAYDPELRICGSVGEHGIPYTFPLVLTTLGLDLGVFSITMVRLVAIRARLGNTPGGLVGTIMRDGTVWFFAVIVFRTLTAYVIGRDLLEWIYLALYGTSAITVALFSRIYLNLRIAASQAIHPVTMTEDDYTTDYTTTVLTPVTGSSGSPARKKGRGRWNSWTGNDSLMFPAGVDSYDYGEGGRRNDDAYSVPIPLQRTSTHVTNERGGAVVTPTSLEETFKFETGTKTVQRPKVPQRMSMLAGIGGRGPQVSTGRDLDPDLDKPGVASKISLA